MRHKPGLWIVCITLVTLAIGAVFLVNAEPVAAHNYVAFLASPYYGAPGDGVSQRWTDTHDGIDFVLRWTAVLAAADGNVDQARWQNPNCHDESQPNCSGNAAGFGLYVRINHSVAGETNYTYYGHLSVARTTMGSIRKGEWVGTSGDSGWSTGPHLHFEVRHGCSTPGRPPTGCAVNPDNAGGTGTSLWNDGEWSGTNPTISVPAWQFPGLGYVAEIIIDDDPNNASGFTRGRSGTVLCGPHPDPSCPYWYRVTTAGYGNDYFWTYDYDNVPDYWARWNPPSLPVFSNYRLSAYIPCEASGGNNDYFGSWKAPYTIQRYDAATTVIVDQLSISRTGVCNRFIGFGTYRAQTGNSTYVHLSDATGETGVARTVGVDAVKFARVNVGPFEAENYRENISRSGYTWELRTDVTGYSGSGFMQVPTTGGGIDTGYATTSPELRYRVIFPSSGTYYIWIRGYGGSPDDDSIHAGIDGQAPTTADRISGCNWHTSGWYWCNSTMDGPRATLVISTPGLHTLNLWMREDGFRVDRVLLTTDSTYTP